MPYSTIALYALVSVIFCALVCRARHMDENTAAPIVWQYRALMVGVVVSLFAPADWAAVCVCAGVATQLLISSIGWPQVDICKKPPEPKRLPPWWMVPKE